MAAAERTVPLDALVVRTAERNSGVSWPLAVDHRVDQMLAVATDFGLRTTRKEIVAAIIATFDPDPEQLERILKRYRRAEVREVLVTVADESDGVISFPRQRSGPRQPAGGGLSGDRGD